MHRTACSVVALIFLISLASGAQAAVIPDLFPTGVDAGGQVLTGGAADPHYDVIENSSQPAVVVTEPPPNYLANDASSKWVWQNADGSPTGNVTRTFRTTFDLTGWDPTTASISGTWATDNEGLDILINGTSTGNTITPSSSSFWQADNSPFNQFHSFTITSGFAAGTNTLDFVVKNSGGVGGFRVGGMEGTAEVPEPATAAVAGCGAIALLLRRRRRV